MNIQDLTAVQILVSLDQHNLRKTMMLLHGAVDAAEHVQPMDAKGVQYTSLMFADHSVLSFHWEENTVGTITGVDCFLMFAYQQEKEIPQCVKDNNLVIGTMKYAIIPPTPDTLQ